MGMVQPGQGHGLRAEALDDIRAVAKLGPQQLDRHLAFEQRVQALEDLTHCAFTELLHNPVVTKFAFHNHLL